MANSLLTGIYGWAALLSAAACLLTFLSGVLFFAVSERYGKANDIFSLIQLVMMLPLVFLFDQLMTPPSFTSRAFSTLFGLGGLLISGYGQLRLITGAIDFNQSQRYFPAGAAIGLWLMMANLYSLGSGELPSALVWIGMAAGLGYLLVVGGFIKGGQKDPLFYTGALVLGLCYPAWGLWLGRLILASSA